MGIPRFLQSVYATYPDNDSIKEVFLQTANLTYAGTGDRHVVMWWWNETEEPNEVAQLIQLTGQSGHYSYYSPVAQKIDRQVIARNQQFSLGEYTRAQRDQILQLASNVAFEKKSTTNGCRVWTRDLLEIMVTAGLISGAKFAEVDTGVPLVKRRSEA
jgi:hypothetical protein